MRRVKILANNRTFPVDTESFEGWFHCFFVEGTHAEPAAIIEKDDGTVEIVMACRVQFTTPPDADYVHELK